MYTETFEQKLQRYKEISLGLACAEAQKERKKNVLHLSEMRNKVKALKQGQERSQQFLFVERKNQESRQEKIFRNQRIKAEKAEREKLHEEEISRAKMKSSNLHKSRLQIKEQIFADLIAQRKFQAAEIKRAKAYRAELKTQNNELFLSRARRLASQVKASKQTSVSNVQSFFQARKELFRSVNETFLSHELAEKARLETEIVELEMQERRLMFGLKETIRDKEELISKRTEGLLTRRRS